MPCYGRTHTHRKTHIHTLKTYLTPGNTHTDTQHICTHNQRHIRYSCWSVFSWRYRRSRQLSSWGQCTLDCSMLYSAVFERTQQVCAHCTADFRLTPHFKRWPPLLIAFDVFFSEILQRKILHLICSSYCVASFSLIKCISGHIFLSGSAHGIFAQILSLYQASSTRKKHKLSILTKRCLWSLFRILSTFIWPTSAQ